MAVVKVRVSVLREFSVASSPVMATVTLVSNSAWIDLHLYRKVQDGDIDGDMRESW